MDLVDAVSHPRHGTLRPERRQHAGLACDRGQRPRRSRRAPRPLSARAQRIRRNVPSGESALPADDTGRWPGPGDVDLAAARAAHVPWRAIDDLVDVPALIVAVDIRKPAAMDTELDRVGLAAGGSIYPFVENILLAARPEGLGGVMTTFLVRQEVAARQLWHRQQTRVSGRVLARPRRHRCPGGTPRSCRDHWRGRLRRGCSPAINGRAAPLTCSASTTNSSTTDG